MFSKTNATICDECPAEVLELVHILQGLTTKQDSLALLTRDACGHHLVFEALMRMPTAATAEYYHVVGIGEVGHMDVSSNLNPWIVL